jgi:hypothetical protein
MDISNTPWHQWILEEIIIISWGITVVIIIFLWIFSLMDISTGVMFFFIFFASVDTGSH